MSAGAAGLDLASAADEPIEIPPGGRVAVPTGLAFEIPPGFEGQVRPRSGLARKFGITLPNAPGTIDSDYRGEVQVLLANLGAETYVVQPGDRVAQLVIAPVVTAELEEAASLEDSDRVRKACLAYIQRAYKHFYPERPDLVREAQQLASTMGGRLELPTLSWKYFLIEKPFGYAAARRFRHRWNQYKSDVLRSWDKALFRLQGENKGQDFYRDPAV